MLQFRFATVEDSPLLAHLNAQLTRDEGHRNPMTEPELQERMRHWLQTEYRAVLFEQDGQPVAYALYRDEHTAVYLRHFFVTREHRRQGVGRTAMRLLLADIFADYQRVYLDVLISNERARKFWQSLGLQDYAVTMEIRRSCG